MVTVQFPVFTLLFISLNLHILRNLHPLYLVLPAVLFCLLFFLQFIAAKKDQMISRNIMLFPFILSLLFIVLLSCVYLIFGLFYNSIDEVLIGASRLFLAPLIAFVVSKMLWTKTRIEKILLIFSLIAAGGSLTLLYQFLFGEITWFAESSARAGFARYASLFGNLTAIGMVAAIGIITTLFVEKINVLLKSLLLTSLLIGLALSLQKASVANLVLALGLSLLFADRERRAKIAKIIVGVALIISIGLSFLPEIQNIALATIQNFRFDENIVQNEDDTVGVSIMRRTMDLPYDAISAYGYEYLLTGVGVIGSAGTLGFPEAPSTHNSFSDSILTGGVLNLTVMLCLLYLMGREVMRPIPNVSVLSNNQYACARAVYFLIVLNLPFVSGILFQPNSACLFYFFMGLASAGYFRGERVRYLATT